MWNSELGILLDNINSIDNFVQNKNKLQYTKLVLRRKGERAGCDLLLCLSFIICLEINKYSSQNTKSKLNRMKAPNPLTP
jgi:hypothetical protein